MHLRKPGLRLAVLVVLMAALLALTAAVAVAGPQGPTLGVTELQARIDANGGSMNGYLRTVVKGSAVIQIPVTVLAVTTGFGSGPADMSSLILFQATGPEIDKIGGIASGMSGSPIYVNDNGIYKLVGALSYGDMFTTGGTGLATPIEAMARIETYSSPSLPRTLSSPVIVDGQLKDRVMIAPDSGAVTVEPANTIVAKPLAAVFIGGLDPKSPMYKAYSRTLESKGIDVVALQGGLSSKVSPYNAKFTGGSAVAALAARGDLWVGGVGTVTYTDGNTVVAFGHPAFFEGESGLYLCNAWIDGIWPSAASPYKLGRPAAVRGTLTQDRTAGILGVDGMVPADIPITATATNLATGKVASSAAQMPPFVADSSTGSYFGLPAAAAYIAGSRVFDAGMNPGSALTTTTVVVSDETTTYRLVRRNVYSEGYDISMGVTSDVQEMVTSFQSANANGIARAHVLSVDLVTTFSAARKEAEIVDLTVKGGLKTGANTVTVSFLQYGNPATQTVDVPLRIPSGVPVTGELSASAVNNPGDGGGSSEGPSTPGNAGGAGSSIDRRTVKDVVDELTAEVDNTVIDVTFSPAEISTGESDAATTETFDSIETTLATPWVVSGSATKTGARLDAYADKTTVRYGQTTTVHGELTGAEGGGMVTATYNGANAKTLPLADGAVSFVSPRLYKKTTVEVTFLGNETTLPARDTLVVKVYAKTSLSASKTTVTHGTPVTFTAAVLPKTAGGSVSFQRWTGSTWSTMSGGTRPVPASGSVTYQYTPSRAGTVKVRARFNGSASNLASSSTSVSLTVK